MRVISRQAHAPMDPDTHIRNVAVDQQLANIRAVTYLPQLNNRRSKYGDLLQIKALIITIRFIPNYSRTWVANYEAGGMRLDTVGRFS